VIHLASASATAVNCSITPPAAEIKTVLIDTSRLTMSPDPNTLTYVEFDPVRGTAVNSEGASTASVELRSKTGTTWRLRAVTTIMGRVATCSPSGAGHLSGYPSDCS
jgi:hypothetical protein